MGAGKGKTRRVLAQQKTHLAKPKFNIGDTVKVGNSLIGVPLENIAYEHKSGTYVYETTQPNGTIHKIAENEIGLFYPRQKDLGATPEDYRGYLHKTVEFSYQAERWPDVSGVTAQESIADFDGECGRIFSVGLRNRDVLDDADLQVGSHKVFCVDFPGVNAEAREMLKEFYFYEHDLIPVLKETKLGKADELVF